MTYQEQSNITELLQHLSEDDSGGYQQVFSQVYKQLHQIAQNIRFRWQGDLTLNTTSLVHEAYLKLIGQKSLRVESRRHFFAIAAKAMRQVLMNHAEARMAQKRGGKNLPVDIANTPLNVQMTPEFAEELLDLNEALKTLEEVSERQSKVVNYRFFTGLTLEETAQLLGVSERTIKRDWNSARIWLYQHLKQ